MSFFMELELLIFVWKNKTPRIAKTILKKSRIEGIPLPDFRQQGHSNQKSVVLAHKYIDQWNRIAVYCKCMGYTYNYFMTKEGRIHNG